MRKNTPRPEEIEVVQVVNLPPRRAHRGRQIDEDSLLRFEEERSRFQTPRTSVVRRPERASNVLKVRIDTKELAGDRPPRESEKSRGAPAEAPGGEESGPTHLELDVDVVDEAVRNLAMPEDMDDLEFINLHHVEWNEHLLERYPFSLEQFYRCPHAPEEVRRLLLREVFFLENRPAIPLEADLVRAGLRHLGPVERDQLCGICLSGFEDGGSLYGVGCSHAYHFPCLIEWLERKPKCPECKAGFRPALWRRLYLAK